MRARIRGTVLALLAGTTMTSTGLAQGPRVSDAGVDSLLSAANDALERGRPWEATRLLSPSLRTPAPNTAIVLTAARAAAHWEGWSTIVRLLGGKDWLERERTGTASALLGRALLERGEPERAIPETREALRYAASDNRTERMIIHARAFDRALVLDSAAHWYRAAADSSPLLGDWLLLRAAGVTADSGDRTSLLSRIRSAPARQRIARTEALARERTGDWRGAAAAYTGLGARLASLRLRLANGDSAVTRAARVELATLLTSNLSRDDSREAIALFDRHFPNRTAAEEIRIGRRAAAANLAERAARGFAAGRRYLTDRDRFTYATVLARLGRADEAVPLFDAVKTPELRGDAAYQRARLLLRSGQRTRAEQALARIPDAFPHDSVPAATALYLAGDLLSDEGQDDSARARFAEAARRFPTTGFGRKAAFQAAMIGFVAGAYRTAAAEFDRIAADRDSPESLGAQYWAGRSYLAAGDTGAARDRWLGIGPRGSDSYYAMLASRRLGIDFWRFAPPPDTVIAADLPEPLLRAKRLHELGLDPEARLELDAFISAAPTSGEPLAAARSLASGNWHSRALRLAQRFRSGRGLADRDITELLYPLPYSSALLTEARQVGVDPMLVAGLIRQESLFDPTARSVADARGLMQVLPSVGAELARSVALPEWDPVLLYQPDLNISFGIEHLAASLSTLEWPERALAAYNAGTDRVARWRKVRGVEDDPEVFVERIPFAETRDYVRRVMTNYAIYSALYGTLVP